MECLTDLDLSLRKLNSRLLVVRGKPEATVERLISRLSLKFIYYEQDSEPYARVRDSVIVETARKHGVHVESFVGHTLFDLDDLLRRV